MTRISVAGLAVLAMLALTSIPAHAEDPCAPTSQPAGVLVPISHTCEGLLTPTNYYVEANVESDPEPAFAETTLMGVTKNARGCESSTELTFKVSAGTGVPMAGEGFVECKGENVWGLKGTLRIQRNDLPDMRKLTWGPVGYNGVPPISSSSTWYIDAQPTYNCQTTGYYAYRGRLDYRVLRSATDTVGTGGYYAITNWFKGRCK